MANRVRKRIAIVCLGVVLLLGVLAMFLPGIGAAVILHPPIRRVVAAPPPMCQDVTFKGDGVELRGWRGQAEGRRRGTLIYLHGVADNRTGGTGIMERFRKRGFDVIAYDSRAHGESGGEACTYGYLEKEDLRRVLDTLAPGPVILVGGSLGAAVSIQLAASDRRISAIVAAETFSDFRTVATERTPSCIPRCAIERVFKTAEQKGGFRVDAVSPVSSAKEIRIPVLMIHGADDSETPPDHSRRVFEELAGPKQLVLVAGAGHNESLSGDVWGNIESWIDQVLGGDRPPGGPGE